MAESHQDIAHAFEKMSRVLALKGKDRFRVLGYQKTAQSIRDVDKNLGEIAAAGQIQEIAGIGQDLAAKIEEALQISM